MCPPSSTRKLINVQSARERTNSITTKHFLTWYMASSCLRLSLDCYPSPARAWARSYSTSAVASATSCFRLRCSSCSTFGVEVMEKSAEIACEQRAQMMMCARMWGVRMDDVELEHANMLDGACVNGLMACADVILVNNKVFGESLGMVVNEATRPKFLDLKEGALVISLELFVAGGRHAVTECNVDDISAILDVSAHDGHSMDVSWTSGAGKFYVHRVDRAGYSMPTHARNLKRRGARVRPADDNFSIFSLSAIMVVAVLPSIHGRRASARWPVHN
ncbi:histone methylation protein DOT1-domain-containing protein [Lactifluus subvellereus]|nr:histone methylation protein DOT1-domain-containing protein [Lactifluus subvellereus]